MPIRRGALLLILLAGCASPEPSRPGAIWQSLKADTDLGPNRVLFDVALVQRPLEDSFLNDEIWASADEMIFSADERELLELNGFRVGLLVGNLPDKLLQCLQSERSCPQRRARSMPAGTLSTQLLRECKSPADGLVYLGKSKEEFDLDRPRFALDLLPTPMPTGAVRLKITPRFEAGDEAINYKPAATDAAGLKWALEWKRPTRVLAELELEIELAPNQVLIIGPRMERAKTVGYHSFTDVDEASQQLLVLRHVRSQGAQNAQPEIANPKSPPLALQASGF
jgi:hypothetical protein